MSVQPQIGAARLGRISNGTVVEDEAVQLQPMTLAVVPRHLGGVREAEHQEQTYALLDAVIDVGDNLFSDLL